MFWRFDFNLEYINYKGILRLLLFQVICEVQLGLYFWKQHEIDHKEEEDRHNGDQTDIHELVSTKALVDDLTVEITSLIVFLLIAFEIIFIHFLSTLLHFIQAFLKILIILIL